MKASALLALGLLLLPNVAAAECRLQVSTARASVGQPVVVQFECEDEGEEAASEPSLQVRGAAETRGPTRGTSERMTMHNFQFSRSRSTTFTWTVYGTAVGTVTIGPAQVSLGGRKFRSKSLDVTVTNEPARVQPRSDPFGFDPFDFMRGLPTPRPLPPSEPTAPLELNLHAPRGKLAFLHALVSSTEVVVGEPIHFRVFAYGAGGPFVPTALEEAKSVDFLSYAVELEPPFQTEICEVGGEPWRVGKLYDVWLVPLRAGRFSLGRVTATLGGNANYRALRKKLTSEEVFVEVREPPREGRPLTYRVGDAGRLELRAEVHPTALHEGDFVELVVEVSGSGALPTRIPLPENARIEWQEPRLEGGPKADAEKLSGTRRLTYAGKVSGAGALALGVVEFPYYDTQTRKYRVLRGELPAIEVTATDKPAASPSAKESPSPSTAFVLPGPRKTRLDAPKRARVPGWLPLVGIPPLVSAAVALGATLWRRRRERSPRKRTFTPSSSDFDRASALARSGDVPGALRELEKLLFEVLERKFERSYRGFAKEELASLLGKAGLSPELAEETEKLALALVEARYAAKESPFEAFLDRTRRVSHAIGAAP